MLIFALRSLSAASCQSLAVNDVEDYIINIHVIVNGVNSYIFNTTIFNFIDLAVIPVN
jgi:hypothetical protein